MAELSCLSAAPEAMAVLVQLELAQRIVALPGSKEYGALSVLLQLAYRPSILRKVGAQVFRPRPRVDSAMLCLGGREGGCLEMDHAVRKELAIFLRQVFSGRRKKLRNSKALDGVSVPPQLQGLLDERPDSVAPNRFLELFCHLRENP